MTTKFAAFFCFTLLYSATTLMFLPLILNGSCIDRLLKPFARSDLGFLGSFVADLGGIGAGNPKTMSAFGQ